MVSQYTLTRGHKDIIEQAECHKLSYDIDMYLHRLNSQPLFAYEAASDLIAKIEYPPSGPFVRKAAYR